MSIKIRKTRNTLDTLLSALIVKDRDILIVNKPHGLLSVPGRLPEHQDSLYTRIIEQYPLAQVVHRLDMATSGVMVFALRKKAEVELKS